jgi:hypothetical protein
MLRRIAHRLRRILQPSVASPTSLHDAAVALKPITAEELAFVKARFARQKFFIFGHARSGTTLLARLIRLHPEVHCNWQAQFFSDRGPIPFYRSESFQRWLNHPSNRWVADSDPTTVLLRLASDYLLEQQAERTGKRVVGDKSPNGNGMRAIEWLSAVYPDASLIYIVRDGRDTILSKRVQAFIDQPQGLNRADRRVRERIIRSPDDFFDGSQSIFTEDWLQSAASQWAQDVHDCLAAGRESYGERFLWLRFEDLLEAPLEKMREIWVFLGTQPGEGELDRRLEMEMAENPAADWHAGQGFEFIYRIPRGVHGAWHSLFTPKDRELFERSAGTVMKELGY